MKRCGDAAACCTQTARRIFVRPTLAPAYPTQTDRAAENREEKLSGFARELFTGACGRLPEIDAILAASAENWRLHRIARVPLAVLRLAVYELLTAGAENERIIINEALEICRTYADEKAVAFVNGVLGKAADAVGSTRA
mgnify:CR=1 FL=1